MKYWFMLFFLTYLPAFAQEEGYAPAEGVKIRYRIFGKGAPLLIINGGPGGNSEGFGTLAGLLGERYQAITFDQRGTGKSNLSALNATTISMDLMREDMESLRKHLKIERWVLLGQSFGGMLASYYAVKYPERVQGIIYSASGGLDLTLRATIENRIGELLTPQERAELAQQNQKMMQGDTTFETRQKRATALAAAYVVDKRHIPTIAARLMQVDMRINAIVWEDLSRIQYDCKEKLRNFKSLVLILQGMQDIIIVDIARTAHKVFRKSRLVLLENCAHFGWLDAKERYLEEIHRFMRRV